MESYLTSIIEKFIDETNLEDLIDLKRTMSALEIKSYIIEYIKESEAGLSAPIIKRIPLKKTYQLKGTFEIEEVEN